MKSLVRATLVGTGLVLAAVSALEVSVAYAGSTTETTGEYLTASAITAKVQAALVGTKGLNTANIHVTTVGTVVTLTGMADNSAQAELASKVAEDVQGVSQVQNNLKSGS